MSGASASAFAGASAEPRTGVRGPLRIPAVLLTPQTGLCALSPGRHRPGPPATGPMPATTSAIAARPRVLTFLAVLVLGLAAVLVPATAVRAADAPSFVVLVDG